MSRGGSVWASDSRDSPAVAGAGFLSWRGAAVGGLAPLEAATLPASLTPDGRFPLPLTLGARLLVEPALTQLRVQSRALDLALESTQGAVEAFVLLDDYFQNTLS